MTAFFAMGGYAAYVWPAIAFFVLVLALDAVVPAMRRRRLVAEIRARQRRQQHKRDT